MSIVWYLVATLKFIFCTFSSHGTSRTPTQRRACCGAASKTACAPRRQASDRVYTTRITSPSPNMTHVLPRTAALASQISSWCSIFSSRLQGWHCVECVQAAMRICELRGRSHWHRCSSESRVAIGGQNCVRWCVLDSDVPTGKPLKTSQMQCRAPSWHPQCHHASWRYSPIDGRLAMLLQVLIAFAEMLAAKEASVGRQP